MNDPGYVSLTWSVFELIEAFLRRLEPIIDNKKRPYPYIGYGL